MIGPLLGALLASVPVSAVPTCAGRLTGDFAAWGPTRVEAYASRDLTALPVGTSSVGPDGGFALSPPADTSEVYLALWPEAGAPYPWLLSALPVSSSAIGLEIPVTAPPAARQDRQGRSATGWLAALAAALALALTGVWLRRRLSRRVARMAASPERWLPSAVPPSTAWPALVAVLPAAAAGLYGLFALAEPFDLLEHTYFQEAFAGAWPWEVATAPVVAERAHAPGYAVLLWFVTRLGTAEWLVRGVSLIAHLAGGFLVYRLAADSSGRRLVGTVAAALVLFSPLAVRYAGDATPYALVGLLGIASTAVLGSALRTNARRAFIGYAALAALSFYVHYFTAFLAVGQAIAVLVLWVFGGRGPAWSARAASAAFWISIAAALTAVWGAEIVRAFLMSAEDNQVTQAVYPVAPTFVAYVAEHIRVLFGVPDSAIWLMLPLGIAWVAGVRQLARAHPTLTILVLVPFLLVLLLLGVTYGLQSLKFGGRTYYGWRWLRAYVPALALPLAFLLPTAVTSLAGAGRATGVFLALAVTAWTGGSASLAYQRPAQVAAAALLKEQAVSGDAIGVLPAPFYTVGWSYYLHDRDPAYIHPGPSIWDYWGREIGDGRDSRRVFGPIRSFGLPLEALATHGDIQRLWVTAFRERLFAHPEFDEAVTDRALAFFDQRYRRLRRIGLPFMELVLYEKSGSDPWKAGRIQIETARLYRSLAVLPRALDPDYLLGTFRGEVPIDIALPSPPLGAVDILLSGLPPGARAAAVRLVPFPRSEHPGEARLQPPPAQIEGLPGNADELHWRVLNAAHPRLELRLERDTDAVAWPLVITLTSI